MTKPDRYTVRGQVTAALEHRIFADSESQADAIAYVLDTAAGAWICGSAFLAAYLPTYAQRISELRKRGLDVESATCRHPDHNHRGGVAMRIHPAD